MKKTYQKPETLISHIATAQIIAASNYGQPEKGFSLGDLGTTDSESGNLSRRSTVWDDDNAQDDLGF